VPQEFSAGAVIFHRAENKIKYLLLRYFQESTGTPGYWGFVKGHIEPNEDIKLTVTRETEEETGLRDLSFVGDFRIRDEYFFKRRNTKNYFETVHKEAIYFLVESKTNAITLSPEHCDYKWLEYQQAREQLTHESMRKILDKADSRLKQINTADFYDNNGGNK